MSTRDIYTTNIQYLQKDDSENDIWEYKPLEKKRKSNKSLWISKRRCTARKTSKKDSSPSLRSKEKSTKPKTSESGDSSAVGEAVESKLLLSNELPVKCSATEVIQSDSNAAERQMSEDFCPICQMPFHILVVQSQRWHVAECLDNPRDKCTECPDGLLCSSTIPNHYKKFNHTLLAETRANGNAAAPSLSLQTETSGEANLQNIQNNEALSFPLARSQGTTSFPSSFSSLNHTPTPPTKPRNGLLLLRSPGPDDFKKKKGWLGNNNNNKAQKPVGEISSTPVKEILSDRACEVSTETQTSLKDDDDDDGISYSPLSELPAETEMNCRKSLFLNESSGNEHSVILFNDSFSSEDEILAEFIDKNCDEGAAFDDPSSSSSSQLDPVSSLAPTNQQAAEIPRVSKREISSFQSPQSAVLERLRETICSEGHSSQKLNSAQVSSSQDPFGPNYQNMLPQKGQSKAVQGSGLKQTDIGVFFGLKPLKETDNKSLQSNLEASSVPASDKNPGRHRQKKRKADPEAAPAAAAAAFGNDSVGAQGDAGRGGNRGWRRRWNRVNADGEVQLPRCPFYKKIPGTKFVVDAFRYGEIEGITSYFLTHFHSDHYDGLTRTSTFPIYCNRITGNLVKSKLRVAEQFVHILPMNAEVTVEGVRVVLLDANHCPGAAMLLFFLPDGQTVLHTGDFRANPSMETYPELLHCRVQTLYLDTTYCSPEYTFPRQQEVVSFAASRAFELVTLHPRTLVVCGSYSVGKEKVFLALAEVLGSKVCLSRDKYNTMCCLESQQIKERITTDWKAAQVHVLPMMQLSFKKLQDHLARFSAQYDRLVAFKPTGWTFSEQVESVEDIQPQISGNISLYGIPYSEHSSFLELKRFVQWLKPLKIIPTVNVGSWSSRKAMEKCFSEWLSEARAKL
ncbi:DNA cross-link repair 1A protein [Poecilia formosa]|uniref:DNA cross-link repair 1A protein n=1 Tax=Poecilia formosa TaxID=48698 RepID=UPI000443DA82|nr:PREDICTED: DNA cross-link repair 1A protein [Poecilia formosa]